MDANDIVVVDPVILHQGVEALQKSSASIANYVSTLESITAEISANYQGETSEKFQAKMKKLSNNLNVAKTMMDDTLVKKLNVLIERYEDVIAKASQKAEEVDSSFTMQ